MVLLLRNSNRGTRLRGEDQPGHRLEMSYVTLLGVLYNRASSKVILYDVLGSNRDIHRQLKATDIVSIESCQAWVKKME